MKIGILDKQHNKIVATYNAKFINEKSEYPQSRYVYFEIEAEKYENGYYYDQLQDKILYDSSYTPPTVDPSIAIEQIVKDSIEFGNSIIVKFAAENILMGITQQNKTKDVSDFLSNITRYAQTGSLYEVINEIDRLILNEIPTDLSPFVTIERLNNFKQKIESYLS